MQSNQEPNCLFGGIAIPSWESPDDEDGNYGIDPADQCSWSFKMEIKYQEFLNIF